MQMLVDIIRGYTLLFLNNKFLLILSFVIVSCSFSRRENTNKFAESPESKECVNNFSKKYSERLKFVGSTFYKLSYDSIENYDLIELDCFELHELLNYDSINNCYKHEDDQLFFYGRHKCNSNFEALTFLIFSEYLWEIKLVTYSKESDIIDQIALARIGGDGMFENIGYSLFTNDSTFSTTLINIEIGESHRLSKYDTINNNYLINGVGKITKIR